VFRADVSDDQRAKVAARLAAGEYGSPASPSRSLA
jgi:hypothetical protein